MQDLPYCLPGWGTLLCLANLAVASCLVCAAGLLAVRGCRSRSAPVRHGLLVANLLLLLFTPVLTLAVAAGWGGIPILLTPEADRAGAPPPQRAEAGPTQSSQEARAGDQNRGAEPKGAVQASVAFQVTGTLLASVWGAGVLVLAARLGLGLRNLARLWKTLQAVRAPDLEQAAAEAFQALGVEHRVLVYQTRLALTPFSLGLVRPRIVLPEHLPAHLDAEEMRYVLLHEAAHIHRRDHWVVLLQRSCAALFWWNPLVRAVNASLARLREQICDDHVVSAGGDGRRFAEVLVRVAQWGAAHPAASCSTALLDNDYEDLMRRVRRLLRKKLPRPLQMSRGSRAEVAAFAALVMVLQFLSGLRTDDPMRSERPAEVRAALAVGALTDGARPDAPNPAAQPVQMQQGLGGKWLMHLPAGFKHQVTLTPVGPNRYRLDPRKLNSSGVYELKGRRLVIVTPNDRRLLGFEWEIREGRLVLVGQPPVAKTGAKYLGATMVRTAQ